MGQNPSDMAYVDQSADGLNLYLLQGDYDFAHLTLLQSAAFGTKDIAVQANIIGASHAIRFGFPRLGLVINEIFACTELDPEGNRILTCGPLAQVLGKHRLRIGQSVAYSFKAEVTPLKENLAKVIRLAGRARRLQNNPHSLGLIMHFPKQDDAPLDEPPPATILMVKLKKGGRHARIQSVHMYSSENRVVFSESTIDF